MKLVLTIFVTGSILLSSQFVVAQEAVGDTDLQSYSVQGVAERYPAGSIHSQEIADKALTEVNQARATIEARLTAEQHVCYQKFFTTSCLDKATERRRVDLLVLRPIEIEANAYVRHARVTERDRRMAEKMEQSEGKLLKSEDAADKTDAGSVDSTQNDAPNNQAQRKARTDAYNHRVAEHEKEQQRLKENALAEEEKRAANVRRYEEKLKASEARQKEILKNKAEKERSGKK